MQIAIGKKPKNNNYFIVRKMNTNFFCIHFCYGGVNITKEKNNPINENIRCKEMMVIGPNGEQLGIKSKQDALTLANYAGFDLVLMSENSNITIF